MSTRKHIAICLLVLIGLALFIRCGIVHFLHAPFGTLHFCRDLVEHLNDWSWIVCYAFAMVLLWQGRAFAYRLLSLGLAFSAILLPLSYLLAPILCLYTLVLLMIGPVDAKPEPADGPFTIDAMLAAILPLPIALGVGHWAGLQYGGLAERTGIMLISYLLLVVVWVSWRQKRHKKQQENPENS